MSVWVTLIGALAGAAGFFLAFYVVVFLIFGARARGATPKFGVSASEAGQLGLWFDWDPSVYDLQVYRFVVNIFNPFGEVKDYRFTITSDPPQKKPFLQPVILPPILRELLEGNSPDVIVTFTARAVENVALQKSFRLAKLRKLYRGKPSFPGHLAVLKAAAEDGPTVTSLDYDELVARKERIRKLEAAAKAKEAAAKKAAESAAAKAPAAAPGAAPKPPAPAAPKPPPAAPAKPGTEAKADARPAERGGPETPAPIKSATTEGAGGH